MVQHKHTKTLYALKYINKVKCVKMKAVANIVQERRLLEEASVVIHASDWKHRSLGIVTLTCVTSHRSTTRSWSICDTRFRTTRTASLFSTSCWAGIYVVRLSK